MSRKKKLKSFHFLLGTLFVLSGVGISCAPQDKSEIVIDRFDSDKAPETVEYGAKNLGQLYVTSDKRHFGSSGRSLKMTVKLLPDSYHFLASGDGLADPKFAWEKRPQDLDWHKIAGLRYRLFISEIKGAPAGVNSVRIATDIVDGDGEILRARTEVQAGAWAEVFVPFNTLVSRADYQRVWTAVKKSGEGADAVPLNQVDNGVKSYQIEVLGLVADKPVDLRSQEVQVTLYLDQVVLVKASAE